MELKKMSGDEAPERMARELVRECPDEFWHLAEAKFLFLWAEPDLKSGGRLCYAQTSKVPALWQQITGLNFVLKVSKEAWGLLDEREQAALIAHELRHCGVKHDKDGSPVTIEGAKVEIGDGGEYSAEGLALAYVMVDHDYSLFEKDISSDAARAPGLNRVVAAVKKMVQLELDFEQGLDQKERKTAQGKGKGKKAS